MSFQNILGNAQTVPHLRESIRSGRFILAGLPRATKYALALIILATLLCGSALCAQLPKVAQNPAAPKQPLAVEQWFVGDWICSGTMHLSPTSPAVKFTDKFSFGLILDGSWLTYRLHQLEGPHKGQLTLIGNITWDANARLHVRRDMNIGGSRMDMTTPGWDGGKITWTGFMVTGDQKMPATQIFVKKSNTATYNTLQISGPDGKPDSWEEEYCRKIH